MASFILLMLYFLSKAKKIMVSNCVCVCVYHTIKTLLLLLLSRFSRVRLCATPQTAAHQAPRSLGFFRQED